MLKGKKWQYVLQQTAMTLDCLSKWVKRACQVQGVMQGLMNKNLQSNFIPFIIEDVCLFCAAILHSLRRNKSKAQASTCKRIRLTLIIYFGEVHSRSCSYNSSHGPGFRQSCTNLGAISIEHGVVWTGTMGAFQWVAVHHSDRLWPIALERATSSANPWFDFGPPFPLPLLNR